VIPSLGSSESFFSSSSFSEALLSNVATNFQLLDIFSNFSKFYNSVPSLMAPLID
ncbi:16302_t:CDS:1, partial [Dentiscutata heterogama]